MQNIDYENVATTENLHRLGWMQKNYGAISIILFGLSLFSDAFYVGETYKSHKAYELLLIGWLGLFDGHLSWLANVFYLIALYKVNKATSRIWAGFALALAISFLFHEKILINEAGHHSSITAYGWGYFCWVCAIGVLFAGSLLDYRKLVEIVYLKLIGWWVLFCLCTFSVHHFLGADSIYQINYESQKLFNEKCAISGKKIYFKNTNPVKGIYFQSNWGADIVNSQVVDVGTLADGLMNGHHLSFYETTNDRDYENEGADKLPYRRYVSANDKGIATSQLESEYAVITTPFSYERRFNIIGGHVMIKDLKEDKIMAEATYVVNTKTHQVCHALSTFSTSLFMNEVLSLYELN